MNRIDKKFAALKKQRKTALIPFVTAGDPDLGTTLEILRALERGGADMIELGVPFSDPMADGPTIQRASERALEKGASLPRILEMVRKFRRESEIPLILFGYYNPFLRYGLKRFTAEAKAAGVDGVLCVDLPPEESGELKRWTDARGLDTIFLLAPTSDIGRIRLVARRGRGFIYYVSVTGVTGARRSLENHLRARVRRVRRETSLPVGVGFGISTPRQAAWIASFADAAVVGSALIGTMERARARREKVAQAGRFVTRLKRAMERVSKKVIR
ncbi:MAG: tryptophan synthase subunit alpha [Deltaproteobacteria bacterium]|nr:tryptophan synthase subunit alpha [Deltaproteobacteria bacterium]MBI2991602.1 tryptophan synthase subunit alpha [Deltaproteobacteria bacterium]